MYKLVEKTDENKNNFLITIKADWNDGDYLTETQVLNEEQFIEALPELSDLKYNYSGSHELSNFHSEYLEIPVDEYGEFCHTLTNLTVDYVDNHGKIWTVEF